MKSDGELAELCLPYAVRAGLFGEGAQPGPEQRKLFTRAMPLIRERLSFLHEAPEKIAYLFCEPPIPAAEEFIPKKADLAQTLNLLRSGRELVRPLAQAPGDEAAEAFIKEQAEKLQVKLGDLMMPLRVAITGARVSPPLFGSLRILGAERSLERIDRSLAFLRGDPA
jgi:glutamyl-tRNA synthetase